MFWIQRGFIVRNCNVWVNHNRIVQGFNSSYILFEYMILFITSYLFRCHLLFLFLFLHFQRLKFPINLLDFLLCIFPILFGLLYLSKFIHHLLTCHFFHRNDLLSFLFVFIILTLFLENDLFLDLYFRSVHYFQELLSFNCIAFDLEWLLADWFVLFLWLLLLY